MCFFRECAFGASIHTVVIEFQLVSPLRATKQGVFVALRQPKWQSVCNLSGTTDLFVSYLWGVFYLLRTAIFVAIFNPSNNYRKKEF